MALTLAACGGDGGGGGNGPVVPVATVTIRPEAITLAPGAAEPLTAVLADASGNLLTGREVAWRSSDANVATVSSSGEVTAVMGGTATITATSEGRFANAPVTVSVPTVRWDDVSLGLESACARTNLVHLYCWGADDLGAVGAGNGGLPAPRPPVRVTGGRPYGAFAVGSSFACSTSPEGAFCWGANGNGTLGSSTNVGTTVANPTPLPVFGAPRFTSVAAGTQLACGLLADGAVHCWGSAFTFRPTELPGARRFVKIAAGGDHACGLLASGQAFCWGRNYAGQLGTNTGVGTTDFIGAPQPVQGGSTFIDIAPGEDHTCGLTGAGAVWCWGYNTYGQLGGSTNLGRTVPNAVPLPAADGLAFASLSAGRWHACGLTAAGAAWCWGYNRHGALGDTPTTGTENPGPTPQRVATGYAFARLVSGGGSNCGLTADGTLACWGENFRGQLGVAANRGTEVPTTSPVVVPAP